MRSYVARVMQQDLVSEAAAVDMGVDLGSDDALVAEHGLNGAQVGAALQQVGGKGVAQAVGRDIAPDAGRHTRFLYYMKHHYTPNILDMPFDGYEYEIAVFGRNAPRVAVKEIEAQLLDCLGRDRHQAFFAALALHPDEAFVEIEIGDAQVAEFAHPQAAAIHYLDDGAVAMTLTDVEPDGVYHAVYLLHRQDFGQVAAYLGRHEQFAGVGLNAAVHQEELIESSYARQDARLRPCIKPDLVEAGGKIVEVGGSGAKRFDVFAREIDQEFVEVAQVGIKRVGRQTLFQFKVYLKRPDKLPAPSVEARKPLLSHSIYFFHRHKYDL